jgi:hypothetical protein
MRQLLGSYGVRILILLYLAENVLRCSMVTGKLRLSEYMQLGTFYWSGQMYVLSAL